MFKEYRPFHGFGGCVVLCLFCTQESPYLRYMELFKYDVGFSTAWLRGMNGLIASFQGFHQR
jgi:hypothetical protein